MAGLAAHRSALLADEDFDVGDRRATGAAPAPASLAVPRGTGGEEDAMLDGDDEEEEYVSVKKRRVMEAQGRYQRLGKAGAPSIEDSERDGGAQPREVAHVRWSPVPSGDECRRRKALTDSHRLPPVRPQEKASLLVRAAELKKERPVEDESAKRAREELEILRSVTARPCVSPSSFAACGLTRQHCFHPTGEEGSDERQGAGDGDAVHARTGDWVEAARPPAQLERGAVRGGPQKVAHHR